jgi:hypothetical protein
MFASHHIFEWLAAGGRGGAGDRAQPCPAFKWDKRWVRKVRPPQGRALAESRDDSSLLKARKSLWQVAGAASESATETYRHRVSNSLALPPAAGGLALPDGKGEMVG